MSVTPAVDRLTSRQRLARGLKYSAVGPVDVTRGAVGVSAHTLGSSAGWLRDRYRSGRLREDLAAAQDAVSDLPGTLRGARRRRPRPLVLAAAGAVVLAVGAVSFSIVRRSTQPDPSPLPPSVDVTPKP